MAFQREFKLAGLRVPQLNHAVIKTPTGEGLPIRRKRYGTDAPRTLVDQGDFGASVGIIEPGTYATGHRQPSAIG